MEAGNKVGISTNRIEFAATSNTTNMGGGPKFGCGDPNGTQIGSQIGTQIGTQILVVGTQMGPKLDPNYGCGDPNGTQLDPNFGCGDPNGTQIGPKFWCSVDPIFWCLPSWVFQSPQMEINDQNLVDPNFGPPFSETCSLKFFDLGPHW